MNNVMMLDGLQCPKCKTRQNFFAHFEINIPAETLDAEVACCNVECLEESVISLMIRDLFINSGQLEPTQTSPDRK